MWIPQAEVLFDIHVVDTDTHSICDHIPTAVLSSAVCDKKHAQASQDYRATFMPLHVSVDGMLGCEATAFLKLIGDMLSAKWEEDYGTVIRWVHARLSFVILCATLLCVWGSRTK